MRGLTCSTLFGLIAITGLRISEALGLDLPILMLNPACFMSGRASLARNGCCP